jgi:hypothetical protein
MKKFIMTIATAAFIFGAIQAKDDPKKINIDLKASKHEKTRGANPMIKMDESSKDVEMAKPAGYKVEMQRGANFANLNRKIAVKTRGENTNIKKDIPTVDVEKVRPAYNKAKAVEVKRSTSNKMRGANAKIVNDMPLIDKEMARPANYEGANTKGTTVKQVARKAVVKARGENTNIKTDEPTVDIEMTKPGK